MFNFGAGTGRIPKGSLLQQRYLIAHPVGKGGMGAVYLAVDTQSGNKRVAIKEMSQAKLNTTELRDAIDRFQREATMLHALSHPNLPQVYDWFQENGRSYLVMEFIEGKSLLETLNEGRGQPMPVGQVVDCALQLCNVLEYLHQQYPPIVFRDLKPGNIMLTASGRVYLIDFGIARFFKPGQTQDTVAFGTRGFAAPELGGSQTTPRSDLFSLGATLHCCLTTQDPANAPNPFLFAPVRQYNPQVPPELEQLIQQLTQVDERFRPRSAGEVQRILMRIRQNATMGTVYFPNAATPSPVQPYTPPPMTARGAAAPTQRGTAFQAGAAPAPQVSGWQQFVNWYNKACKPYLSKQGGQLKAAAPVWGQKAQALAAQGGQYAGLLAAQSGQMVRTWFLSLPLGNLWTTVIRGYPPVWTVRFKLLLAGVLALALAISVYALAAFHGSYSVAEFGLSLLLLLVIGAAIFLVRAPAPKTILLATGLTGLIACVAFQASPSVQTSTNHLLQHVTLNQLFAVLLVLLAVVPFFRQVPSQLLAWQSARLAPWVEHLAVSGVAFTAALLQYTFGNAVTLLPLSSSIGASSFFTLNDIVVGALALLAFIPLFCLSREFGGWDRFVLLISAAACTLLQFTVGDSEVQIMFPTASGLLVDSVNLLLVGVIVSVCLIAFGRLRRTPSQWDRVITLACATVCALLLWNWSYLSISQEIVNVYQTVSLYQLLFSVFGITALALLVRFLSRRQFSGVDRVMIFLVAIACALLQFSFWYAHLVNLSATGGQLHLASFQLLLAIGLGVAAVILLFRLAYDFKWVDRLTVLGIAITAAFLQYTGPSRPRLSFNVYAASAHVLQVVTLNQLIAVVLWFFACLTLIRLARSSPFGGVDRFTTLLGAGACFALPFTQVPQSLAVSIHYPLGSFVPHQLAIIALALAPGASLFWIGRKFSRSDRGVLLAMFGVALVCVGLGYLGRQDGWLLLALILLTLGVVEAVQMERVGGIRTGP